MSYTSLMGLLVLLAILAVAAVAIVDVVFIYHVYRLKWDDDGILAMLTLALWFFLVMITVTIWMNVTHPLMVLLNAPTLVSAIQYWLAVLMLLICIGGLIAINWIAIRDLRRIKSGSEE